MAAAPDYLLDVPVAASPELALVDAELAAELRRTLRSPSDAPSGLDAPTYELRRLTASTLVDDLIVEPSESSDLPPSGDWLVATEGERPEGEVTADELIVFPDEELPAASLAADGLIDDALIVAPTSRDDASVAVVGDGAEREEGSHYPSLPALDARSTEETDAALLRIREQFAEDEKPLPQRRVRRGFIVASGLVAACSLAGLTAAMQLGFAQFPTLVLH